MQQTLLFFIFGLLWRSNV